MLKIWILPLEALKLAVAVTKVTSWPKSRSRTDDGLSQIGKSTSKLPEVDFRLSSVLTWLPFSPAVELIALVRLKLLTAALSGRGQVG